MPMPTRKIGNDDVSAIGFGLMGLSVTGYGPVESDENRFKVCFTDADDSRVLIKLIMCFKYSGPRRRSGGRLHELGLSGRVWRQ